MIKNFILSIRSIPSKVINKLVFLRKKVKVGKNNEVRGRVYVFGSGQLILEDNVTINSGKMSNPIGGDTRTIFKPNSKDSVIVIGKNTGISNSSFVAFESIKIGENVKIGGNCKFYDSDFHSLDYELRRTKETDKPKTAPIVVKDDAFIGAHSIILKGVTIGERSIIGAGSVVTKSVPNGEIWAGNPAKFIRVIKKSDENIYGGVTQPF